MVETTVEGFSYNLVVKTREAASNPALRSIHFPVTTQGLSLRAGRDGGPAFCRQTVMRIFASSVGSRTCRLEPLRRLLLGCPAHPSDGTPGTSGRGLARLYGDGLAVADRRGISSAQGFRRGLQEGASLRFGVD
ncbi:hypothetical protein HNR71_004581 [Kribbella sandramycini]|uniref:Uncharacterized protein n=1 Tax=Kribbella sandramycini TaxID=60450 RepID=A0A841SGL1_9ACTN|nr:hypothetical protein [Kribbella sandramycini]